MASAVVHYTAAALTDRGRKRPSNEDAFGYSVEHGVYVVCDGMGGAAAGEVASSSGRGEVMRLLTERPQTIHPPTEAEQAVAAANQAIFSRSQRNQNLNGMGTTLVALLVEDRHAWMVNVGDSRGYRMRDSHPLEQITLDHSLVEEQIRMGQMTEQEALRSPLKNVITRALGTQSVRRRRIFSNSRRSPATFFCSAPTDSLASFPTHCSNPCCASTCRWRNSARAWWMPPMRPAATTTSPACWSAPRRRVNSPQAPLQSRRHRMTFSRSSLQAALEP